MEENKSNNVKKVKASKEKTNLQKRDRIVIITILAVIIISIIVIILVVNKKDASKENITNNVDSEGNVLPQTEVNKENVTVKDDGTKENNSSKLKETKIFEGMEVKEVTLTANGGLTKFTSKIENVTNEDFKGMPVTIVFVNKAGEQISTLEGYIGDTKKGQFSYMDASVTADLSNAYDFSMKIK